MFTNKRKQKSELTMYSVLSLIPVVNLVLGVVLIVKYIKTSKLGLWIGIVNLSIGIIYIMSFQTFIGTSSFFRDADNQLTQTQLNMLVKEIEFYKSLNGHYPSSLTELDLENSLVTIYEVYKSKLGSNRIEFFYHVNEDGFYLFSRGFDGVEYTTDDVLPSHDTSNSVGFRLTSYHREIQHKHTD